MRSLSSGGWKEKSKPASVLIAERRAILQGHFDSPVLAQRQLLGEQDIDGSRAAARAPGSHQRADLSVLPGERRWSISRSIEPDGTFWPPESPAQGCRWQLEQYLWSWSPLPLVPPWLAATRRNEVAPIAVSHARDPLSERHLRQVEDKRYPARAAHGTFEPAIS
jgi:hypothetical protein